MIIRTLIDNEAINLMLSFSSIFNHCALITSSNLNSKQLNGSLYFSQYLTHINGLLSSQCPHQIHESELYYLMNVILLVFLCLCFMHLNTTHMCLCTLSTVSGYIFQIFLNTY